MSNDRTLMLELMKEGFKQLNTRMDTSDKETGRRFTESKEDNARMFAEIKAEIKPLIEFKAKSEGGSSSSKYIIGLVVSVILIIISLVNLHLKQP